MKCCSRSTLGVVIGGINILFYIGCAIVVIGLINDSNSSINTKKSLTFDKNYDLTEETIVIKDNAALGAYILSTILAVCLVMVIISGLLIVGIVKRRHKMMWPWLTLSAIGFICSCFRVFCFLIVGLANGFYMEAVLMTFIVGVLAVGLQALILWPIFTLCRDIMQKNNQKPGHVMGGVHYSYVVPDAPPQYNYGNSDLPQKA